MKTMILTGTVALALAGAGAQSAHAGNQEWATVGKVLTGVAVAGIIVAATDGHAQCSVNYSYSSPAACPPCPPCPPVVYCPPPAPVVVCCPPPMVYYCPRPVASCPPPAIYPSRMAYTHPNRWEHHEVWRAQHGR